MNDVQGGNLQLGSVIHPGGRNADLGNGTEALLEVHVQDNLTLHRNQYAGL